MKVDLSKISFNHEADTMEKVLGITDKETQKAQTDMLKVFLSIKGTDKPSETFEKFLNTIGSEKDLVTHLFKYFWETFESLREFPTIHADADILEDEELASMLADNFDGKTYEA